MNEKGEKIQEREKILKKTKIGKKLKNLEKKIKKLIFFSTKFRLKNE
jgi:hypothetical protein